MGEVHKMLVFSASVYDLHSLLSGNKCPKINSKTDELRHLRSFYVATQSLFLGKGSSI